MSYPSQYPDCVFPKAGAEPFNLSEEEMLEVWGEDIPKTEADTEKAFESIVGQYFSLYPQVRLSHPSGANLRIDYIGFDRRSSIDGPIGFELRRATIGSNESSAFTHAVRQSVDYARSTISDPRTTRCAGMSPRFVFVFPCPYQIYERDNRKWKSTYRDLWAQGVLKLTTESAVGAMGYVPRRKDWGLFLAGHPAWWLKSGPTQLALNHSRVKHVGSAR